MKTTFAYRFKNKKEGEVLLTSIKVGGEDENIKIKSVS